MNLQSRQIYSYLWKHDFYLQRHPEAAKAIFVDSIRWYLSGLVSKTFIGILAKELLFQLPSSLEDEAFLIALKQASHLRAVRAKHVLFSYHQYFKSYLLEKSQ